MELDYPCAWVYKIIGPDRGQLEMAVLQIVQDRHCRIHMSRESEQGKYVCLNVEVLVESDSHRTHLYEALKAHPAVKIIL